MVSFRKSLMVVATLALCAGLASAAASDVTNSTVTSILRAEGVTELVNPIVISSVDPLTGEATKNGTYSITLFSTGVPITSFPGTAADLADAGIQLTTNVASYPGTIAAGGGAVTFTGVKITGTGAATDVFAFTITGIRVNASTLANGGPAFASGINFTILAQPADTLSPAGLFGGSPIYTVVNAAFPIPTFSFTSTTNKTGAPGTKPTDQITFLQCDKTTNVTTAFAKPGDFKPVFSVSFVELFSNSFKTLAQESTPGAAVTANSGTRLSATFSGFPANTKLWVPISTSKGTIATKLVTEPLADGSGGEDATAAGTPAGWVEVTPGTAVVYEVTAASSTTTETVEVPVAVSFDGVPALSATTVGSVSGNYAPQSTVPGSSATAPLPRFTSDPKVLTGFYGVAACSTSLLFPYVTTQPGWNVGIAIANTGADPFGNAGVGGTCDFSFYGASGAPAAPVTLGTNGFGTTADRTAIAPGTTSADVASNAVGAGVSFTGYAIAVCDFQFAHGYAFIIGNGAKSTLSNGYLALVLGGVNRVDRPGSPAGFENTGN